MSMEFYYNPLSQPSRAVLCMFQIGKISYNPHNIDFFKKEQNTEAFKKISPTCMVPAIVDTTVTLFESHAILKYLARKYKLETLYPLDFIQQAKLDQYLDWHHTGTRVLTQIARSLFWGPKFFGIQTPLDKDEQLKQVNTILYSFEEIFLNNDTNRFILNFENFTIADLSAINELTTLFLINIEISDHHILLKYMKNLLTIPEIRQANNQFFDFVVVHIPDLKKEYQELIQL